MSNLRKKYSQKCIHHEQLLHEGILDMFQSNSDNVRKVRETLHWTKSTAQTFGMKNIATAVNTAEQKFEGAIANQSARDRAASISYIVTFSDIMSDFFREMNQTVMQLPSVEKALQAANDPANAQKTIGELVGEQGDKISPVVTLSTIIQNQFQKSAGGFLKTIGRFFKTGNLSTSAQALQYVGLDSKKAAEDILNVSAAKYTQMTQAGSKAPTVQLNTQPSNPESGSTASTPSNQSQVSQTSAATQQSTPSQTSASTTGNAQMAAKPTADDIQKRDGALQGVVKNRNAFNTQQISQLSNNEIKADLLKIAQALGISLS